MVPPDLQPSDSSPGVVNGMGTAQSSSTSEVISPTTPPVVIPQIPSVDNSHNASLYTSAVWEQLKNNGNLEISPQIMQYLNRWSREIYHLKSPSLMYRETNISPNERTPEHLNNQQLVIYQPTTSIAPTTPTLNNSVNSVNNNEENEDNNLMDVN